MFQNILSHLTGASVYGVLSLFLLFGSFVAVVMWALRLNESDRKKMRELPLCDDEAPAGQPVPPDRKPNPESHHE